MLGKENVGKKNRCLVSAQETIQPENQESQESQRGYASIPYIKGVSERVRRVLSRENIRTPFKPVKTLGTGGGKQLPIHSLKSNLSDALTTCKAIIGAAVSGIFKGA